MICIWVIFQYSQKLQKMDILQNIDTNVSSMVSSSFDEFISTKVKEAVEKEKEKFLADLNMCEEEYPVYQPSNEFTEEIFESLKNKEEYYPITGFSSNRYITLETRGKESCEKRGEVFNVDVFKENYKKYFSGIEKYYNSLTPYPDRILKDNTFIIHIDGSKCDKQYGGNYGYGISNKGVIYMNVPVVNPYGLVNINKGSGVQQYSKNIEYKISILNESFEQKKRDYFSKLHANTNDNSSSRSIKEVLFLQNEEYKREINKNYSSKYHLYDLSTKIKKGGLDHNYNSSYSSKCRPAEVYHNTHNTTYKEGSGCRCGVFLVKNVKKVEYEEEDPRNEKIVDEETYKRLIRKKCRPINGKRLHGDLEVRERYPPVKKIKEEIEYKLEGDSKEDAVRRYLENDICPDCGAGELLFTIDEIGFDPRVINKYPLNKEYIEVLRLIKPENLETIFGIQTIYAKYHPRANENFVIEEKIKKLSQIEKVVEERVEEEKNELEKEKEIYSEKIKQVNEEKLKRIFSMFILRNERKENIKDKNAIREMIKRTNDKCGKKLREQEDMLEKQRYEMYNEKNEFEKEKQKFYEEKEEYEKSCKTKVKTLLDIANDINEINEIQEDTMCKSEELFDIIKKLTELSV